MLTDTFSNRLKTALDIRGIKPSEICERTKLDKSLISQYLSGKFKAKQNTLSLLAEKLNVSETWLMGYDVPIFRNIIENKNIEAIKIPILGKISAGVPILAEESFEGYALAPAVQIKSDREYFYLRVKGDSMNLKIPEDSIVLVEQTNEIANGDIGIIAVNGYEATIKKYRKENNLVILEPMSNNSKHNIQIYNTCDTEIHILGKVISFQGNI